MLAENKTSFRVTYSDTDQMGYMHHSNYLKYYETARWELFRNIGIPYRELEEQGILLPVVDTSIKYLKPALYDQHLKITTRLEAIRGARILFRYITENESGEVINEAGIAVACVRKSTGKACIPPKWITEILRNPTT
ncbi:MAG TPA: thioesterase family protein [Bacteroidales bacterium]|nr:thioesterase family protein [Bacteroidales bacterium]